MAAEAAVAIGSPVIVGGLSMDGEVTVTITIEHPDVVAGLVLIAAGRRVPHMRSVPQFASWLAARPLPTDDVARIRAPTLRLHGLQDGLVEPQGRANRVAASRLLQLPDCGHWRSSNRTSAASRRSSVARRHRRARCEPPGSGRNAPQAAEVSSVFFVAVA